MIKKTPADGLAFFASVVMRFLVVWSVIGTGIGGCFAGIRMMVFNGVGRTFVDGYHAAHGTEIDAALSVAAGIGVLTGFAACKVGNEVAAQAVHF